MAQTASDILIEILQEWGVDTIFGLPGDGINGIMEALRKKADVIRFVQVRHRRGRSFHGVRLREIYGPPRRLPGHIRTRRHSSSQRPV